MHTDRNLLASTTLASYLVTLYVIKEITFSIKNNCSDTEFKKSARLKSTGYFYICVTFSYLIPAFYAIYERVKNDYIRINKYMHFVKCIYLFLSNTDARFVINRIETIYIRFI